MGDPFRLPPIAQGRHLIIDPVIKFLGYHEFAVVEGEAAEMFKIKRIYDALEPADGYRVLVDRVWPRGVSKEQARIGVWMKEVAPSTQLRKWFAHDPKRWAEFQKRYREELKTKSQLITQLRQLEKEHGAVTLLYSARDQARNQAVVLRGFLQGHRVKQVSNSA